MSKEYNKYTWVPSYINRSRIATRRKRDILANLLPSFAVTQDDIRTKLLNFPDVVISLEIGFGDGRHLLQRALTNTDSIFIGCETYLNGVAQLLSSIQEHKVRNILIYNGDARDILERLPDGMLDNIYILFPDPWQKRKQHKRRLINGTSIHLFLRKLKKELGRLIIATDHDEYAKWIRNHLDVFQQKSKLCTTQPEDWVETKYSYKALATNTTIHYFSVFSSDNI